MLEISNLTKYFSGLAAIVDLDLNVRQGEIFGLIGPNGAGKSTALNMIGGSLSPTRGKLIFKGQEITNLSPHQRAQRGIARVFQGNILFQNFTALTNVLVGFHRHNKIGFWGSFLSSRSSRSWEKVLHEKAMGILQFTGLAQQAEEPAINLPHGKQRTLSLAIALATEPDFLLLDEPVTGMNAEETETMVGILRAIREEMGITSIVVEHNMGVVMGLCDRIGVLNYGRKIAEGSPEEIADNPAVIEAYLGVEQDVA